MSSGSEFAAGLHPDTISAEVLQWAGATLNAVTQNRQKDDSEHELRGEPQEAPSINAQQPPAAHSVPTADYVKDDTSAATDDTAVKDDTGEDNTRDNEPRNSDADTADYVKDDTRAATDDTEVKDDTREDNTRDNERRNSDADTYTRTAADSGQPLVGKDSFQARADKLPEGSITDIAVDPAAAQTSEPERQHQSNLGDEADRTERAADIPGAEGSSMQDTAMFTEQGMTTQAADSDKIEHIGTDAPGSTTQVVDQGLPVVGGIQSGQDIRGGGDRDMSPSKDSASGATGESGIDDFEEISRKEAEATEEAPPLLWGGEPAGPDTLGPEPVGETQAPDAEQHLAKEISRKEAEAIVEAPHLLWAGEPAGPDTLGPEPVGDAGASDAGSKVDLEKLKLEGKEKAQGQGPTGLTPAEPLAAPAEALAAAFRGPGADRNFRAVIEKSAHAGDLVSEAASKAEGSAGKEDRVGGEGAHEVDGGNAGAEGKGTASSSAKESVHRFADTQQISYAKALQGGRGGSGTTKTQEASGTHTQQKHPGEQAGYSDMADQHGTSDVASHDVSLPNKSHRGHPVAAGISEQGEEGMDVAGARDQGVHGLSGTRKHGVHPSPAGEAPSPLQGPVTPQQTGEWVGVRGRPARIRGGDEEGVDDPVDRGMGAVGKVEDTGNPYGILGQTGDQEV